MNKHRTALLDAPMGRREMLVLGAKAFAGAAVLLSGCAGSQMIAVPRRPRAEENPERPEGPAIASREKRAMPEAGCGTAFKPPRRLGNYLVTPETGPNRWGRETSLGEYLERDGRPAVLTVWNEFCDVCMREMGHLQRISEIYTEFQIIGVQRVFDRNTLVNEGMGDDHRWFLNREGITIPQVAMFEEGGNVDKLFTETCGPDKNGWGMPLNLILDGRQNIVYRAAAIIDEGCRAAFTEVMNLVLGKRRIE